MSGYRAVVYGPGGLSDPLSQRVDIWITDGQHVLSQTGLWEEAEEGVSLSEPTLSIPAEAMEALVAAIDRWQGQPSHAKTEAAVLREWLAKEQSRVDEVLRR